MPMSHVFDQRYSEKIMNFRKNALTYQRYSKVKKLLYYLGKVISCSYAQFE